MVKITIPAESKKSICTCGKSEVIPFCDGSHRELNEKEGSRYKSLKITNPSKKEIEVDVDSSNWKEEN